MITAVDVKPVNKVKFSRYGEVIEQPEEEEWTSEAVDFWSELVCWEIDKTSLAVSLGIAKERELKITKLERHLETGELLIPVGSDLIVPVARGERIDNIESFLVKMGQAILLEPGTWHGTPYPRAHEGHFLVLFARDTLDNDFDIRELDEPVNIITGNLSCSL